MKLVVFGLTVSSSWGNGHATLWRGLLRALARRGHDVVFFERDVPYYAHHRDLHALPWGELVLYDTWSAVGPKARAHVGDADAAIVTSYCPDAIAATELVLGSAGRRAFYDLDTPITLAHLHAGGKVDYIGDRGLRDFDLVLSYTGGRALDELKTRLHARRVVPLYGSVDPDAHRPAPPEPRYRCDLSYLGTYAQDRQATVARLLFEPAQHLPHRAFVVGGAMYPAEMYWPPNVRGLPHVPPPDHPAFFSSSRLTLNATRRAMACMGWCPSGRLFEAAACGVPVLSDAWEGLEAFFAPEEEILVARTTHDAVAALQCSDAELRRIARAARARVLSEHTAHRRAAELEEALQ